MVLVGVAVRVDVLELETASVAAIEPLARVVLLLLPIGSVLVGMAVVKLAAPN
jgi:hypothetical protein